MKKRIKIKTGGMGGTQLVTRPQAVIQSQVVEEENRFARETDIREKRIGIVFKVIYVVAAFFAALFTSLSNIRGDGLTDVYILEAASTGFLLCLLVYMLVYIFNELKCLKLKQEAISAFQYTRTEDSYAFVFTYFTLGSIISAFLVMATVASKEYLTNDIVAMVVASCVILASVIEVTMSKRFKKGCRILCSVLWTIVTTAVFIGTAIT